MSGPIVRTGATPKFWQNWDKVFGNGKKKSSGRKAATARAARKKTARPAKKKAAKRK